MKKTLIASDERAIIELDALHTFQAVKMCDDYKTTFKNDVYSLKFHAQYNVVAIKHKAKKAVKLIPLSNIQDMEIHENAGEDKGQPDPSKANAA